MSGLGPHGNRRWQWTMIAIAAITGILGVLALLKATSIPQHPPLKVTIALPTQMSVGGLFVGQNQHLFEKHGLDVSIQPFILGKQALQSVLDGKADLAAVADTPFMLAIMHGEKIAAVSTIFGSRKSMALVARRDRGIAKVEDLDGKTVGTIFGTNAQFFLDKLLLVHGVPKELVKIVGLKPNELVDALVAGRVDAVTVWNPDLTILDNKLGERAIDLYAEDFFVYRFVLVGKQEYIARHPAEVRQVLFAMEESTRFIQEHPEQARVIISKSIGIDPVLMSGYFDPNDFYLTLDQTLLLALGDQTRWAMKQGLVPVADVPNYLHYIRQEPLESVLPSAVKIIR